MANTFVVLKKMRAQTAIAQWWYTKFFSWLDKRAPPAEQHSLHLKNLYVLPTVTGWMFLVLAALIWLLGTNYQNNLILALSYLQVSLFVVVILHTYNNLAGMRLRYLGSQPSFVGESAAFELEVSTGNRSGSDSILLKWLAGPARAINLESGEQQKVRLLVPASRRGIFRPGHMLLKSQFPLSMVRCWTYLKFNAQTTVYPAPIACDHEGGISSDDKQEQSLTPTSGDLWGFRAYQAGDLPNRISWKHYAREQGLITKITAAAEHSDQWLDWQDFFRGDTELCLSNLCYWALELSRQDLPFGLRLPGQVVEVGRGQAHLRETLSMLAHFGE